MNQYLGTCFIGGKEGNRYVYITAPNSKDALDQLEDYTIVEGLDCISYKVISCSKIKQI